MSRTARQHTIDRAVIRSLRDALGNLVRVDFIADSVAVKLDGVPFTLAEVEESLRYAEREHRALGVSTETGAKYKLTEAGEAWALENRI